MKTYILDDNWDKVASGEWTVEQWKSQAKEGPCYDASKPKSCTNCPIEYCDFCEHSGKCSILS